MSATAFSDLTIDYVEFYVHDADASARDLAARYDFTIAGISGGRGSSSDHYSLALRQADITLVITEAIDDGHPAAAYVRMHGDGVANIALGTTDVVAAFNGAVARGARPVSGPTGWTESADRTAPGAYRTATIMAFGDLTHTLVERSGPGSQESAPLPPGFGPVTGAVGIGQPAGRAGSDRAHPGLLAIDHFAACLPAGTLDPTVAFYESALGFSVIFEERIVVGAQAMLSRVVQSASSRVILTLIEPDLSAQPGQIDEFVKNHDGAGIQHIAFRTSGIAPAVSSLRAREVEFLTAPSAYYRLLTERLHLAAYSVEELQELNILVDEDHDGQLFQIFAKSTHPRRTFFFELIERLGARTFGSGNIKALYEAVEAERIKIPGSL
jgi:4-hydroxymandelate synthase